MMKIKNTYSLLFILFFGITFALQGQEKSNKIVTGTVVNAINKEPLVGVNVRVGKFSSVITDEKGAFSIKVPDGRATLVLSSQEFQNKEVALKGRSKVEIEINNKDFNTYYSTIHSPLGDQSNSSVVSAVSVREGNLATSRESAANMLSGNEVSGMRSIMRSGIPGIGSNNFIRGYNTLNSSTQPLIVIDGMMIETNTFNNNSIINGYSYDPLSDINPKDIANITVIKDAVSIYGSRAANGVILIETNKTDDVTTKIDFYASAGLNSAPDNIRMMNASQYKNYLSNQLNSSGLYTNSEISGLPYFNESPSFQDYEKYHNSTDWQKEVFDDNYVNEYYLKVTGGDEIAKYGLSIGYTTNGGVISNSEFSRFTTRFNADTSITDRLSLSTNLSVSYTDRSLYDDGLLSTSPISSALNKSPFLAPYTENADGVVTDVYQDVDNIGGFSNPVVITDVATFVAKDYNLYGQLNFGYKISDKLTLKSLSGVNYIKNRQNVFLPDLGLSEEFNEYGDAFYRTSKVSVESLFSVYNDTRLNYVLNVDNKHDFSLNLGVRYNQNNYENSYSISGNSGDDQFTSLNNGNRDTFVTSGNIGNWKYASIYANGDYSFLNKYFVSYNLALDSSSRFGDDKSTGIFPALGLGWLISSENFMANNKVIDKLKLRVSYGLTGNDGIGNYNAESYFVSTRFLEGTGLVNGNIAKSSIGWEETAKANFGLDVGLLNERLSLNLDYFDNRTSGLLNMNEINQVYGSEGFLSNEGKLKNNGFELSVNARVVNTENFSWDVGGNISQYKNEIVSLPGDQQILDIDGVNATIINKEGSALGLFYGYKTNGIYNNAAEASADGLNWTDFAGFEQSFVAGDVRFVNSDASDNVINEDDRVVIGNPNPDFTGMVYNTFTYKNVSLSAIFSFSQGNDVYNAQRWQTESMSGLANQSTAVANRWAVANQDTDIPRAVYGDAMGNSRFSDRWIEDGSYIRLKTLSVSYSPDFFNATLSITANNLFTITDYLGFDPEVSSSQTSYLQGIDAGFTPQYTSVLIGLRVGL
ncbi:MULTISPECIES: SusC/RagA family TonB-linked outer membrane protein [unclassified Algibacter]|uniref:SusC/RagA family TonB-linked outer membrane protein n=1 Tax=unclassified Algibacter TaxID=2615009 RepID=UPI00131C4E78|nr:MULTISPECIES: SusC/RagA family TonB-linked outer membrane protein [unclassified Algibacter]MCL5129803.1 SusC/RagA family TonB-linked outer membrane protein [Algibacter sp. L4_22]